MRFVWLALEVVDHWRLFSVMNLLAQLEGREVCWPSEHILASKKKKKRILLEEFVYQYQLYWNNDKYVLKYHKQFIRLKTASVRNIMPVISSKFLHFSKFLCFCSRGHFSHWGFAFSYKLVTCAVGVTAPVRDSLAE